MHTREYNFKTRLSRQTDVVNMAASSSQQITKGKGSSYHCCVPLCTSDGRYDPTLHFHHIPRDENLRKQWIHKIRRDEGPLFKVTKATVVCSKHFKREDYSGWTPVVKRLAKGAVPSVFDWSTDKPPRRALKRKILAPEEGKNKTSCQEPEPGETEDNDPVIEMPVLDVPANGNNKDAQIRELQDQLQQKFIECDRLKIQMASERFGINRFSSDDKLISFYTGFPSYQSFLCFYECIEPSAQNMQSAYYEPSDTISLAGRKRCMLLIDELFMFLCRLRVGLMEQDLSVRFNCSIPTVSRKIVTWANFLYFCLGRIPIWLSRSVIDECMPEPFRELYPRTRVIIDCTEIRTQRPSSLVLNSQMYSNYKSTNTFKCLLCIAPHGAVTFISDLYTGCMSDVEITKLSGILDLLEPNDDVMADKGFTLRKVLEERNVTLNIPPFLSSKRRFTPEEIKNTEKIAKLRIHVERVNRRVKENHLFDAPLPLSLAGSANQLWAVACLLANFRGPIVQAWAQKANGEQ